MVSLCLGLPTLTVALLVFGRHTTNPRFQRSAFVLAASTGFTGLESRLEQRSVCIHIYTSRLPHQLSWHRMRLQRQTQDISRIRAIKQAVVVWVDQAGTECGKLT